MATSTVLDSIVEARTARIPELRERFGHLLQAPPPRSQRSFADALRTRSGEGAAPRPALIMECKAASPSRGTIRADYDPAGLARAYAPWAAAVSVLTEPDRFNGSFEDLAAVRAAVDAPVLCKDFVLVHVDAVHSPQLLEMVRPDRQRPKPSSHRPSPRFILHPPGPAGSPGNVAPLRFQGVAQPRGGPALSRELQERRTRLCEPLRLTS